MYKISSLDDVFCSVKNGQDLAFDTETKGKYGKIQVAQFYQRGWDSVLVVLNPCPYTLMGYLTQLKENLIMQNASYDVSTIQRQTGTRFCPNNFDDTLLLGRIHWPAIDSYTLDVLMFLTLDYDPYIKAGINKKQMQKANWDNPSHEQLTYGSIDVFHLLDVYDKVKAHKNSFIYKLDHSMLEKTFDWQNNGLVVNRTRLDAMRFNTEQELKKIHMPINANSWQQVRKWLGVDQSDALALLTFALRDNNERAYNIIRVRKLRKLLSFLDKFEKDAIYGIFAPLARSGRYTCDQQNLQQLPRATKSLFQTTRKTMFSDYAQLELRSITAITGEPAMYNVFKEYGDVHLQTAQDNNSPRQNAKTINFNALYGGGAGMMQSIFIKDLEVYLPKYEVAKALHNWKNRYRAIAAWQEKGIRDHRAGRLGSTASGRKYRGNLMTDQLNIENQGTGAEVAKLAMHYMYDDMKALDCHLCNFVHDSYILDVPDDKSIWEQASKRKAEAMQEAWFEVIQQCKVKDVPMPIEIYVGNNWGDIEKGEYDYEYKVR